MGEAQGYRLSCAPEVQGQGLDAQHWIWIQQKDPSHVARRFQEVLDQQLVGFGAVDDVQPYMLLRLRPASLARLVRQFLSVQRSSTLRSLMLLLVCRAKRASKLIIRRRGQGTSEF